VGEAGVRELRDHLSRYLERVKAGEELTVTDRGRAVARLVPATGRRVFDDLVDEGLIEPAAPGPRRRPQRRVIGGPVSDLVAEGRR
jgi:prevent-host-death family protein